MKVMVPWCLRIVLSLLFSPLFAPAQPDIAPLPIQHEENTERLLDMLADQHPDVRARIAARFADIYELQWQERPDQMMYVDMKARLQVEAALIRLFQHDPAPAVRRASALTLGQLKLDKAVGVLAGALKDTDAGVRAAAALGLGYFKDPRAVQPLATLLADPRAPDRALAIEVLCGYGDLELVEPVARDAAIYGLAGLSDLPSIHLVVAAFNDREAGVRGDARWYIEDAIRHRGEALAPLLPRIIDEADEATRQSLLLIVREAAPAPVAAALLHRPSVEFRRAAVHALAEWVEGMGPRTCWWRR